MKKKIKRFILNLFFERELAYIEGLTFRFNTEWHSTVTPIQRAKYESERVTAKKIYDKLYQNK
jgi:hypothetical protein